jgi:hypothetical protein
MNHEVLTKIARVIERNFPQSHVIGNLSDSLNTTIIHVATHLPVLGPSSKVEEFAKMDDLQTNIRNMDKLNAFLIELKDSLENAD